MKLFIISTSSKKKYQVSNNIAGESFLLFPASSQEEGIDMGNSTDYLGIRLSKELYEDFKAYCKRRNLSVAGAIELLADECIKKNNVPFALGVSNEANLRYEVWREKTADGKEKTNEARKSIFLERSRREAFQKVCEEKICLKMSNVVKAFMIYCVTCEPKLPYSFDSKGDVTNGTN